MAAAGWRKKIGAAKVAACAGTRGRNARGKHSKTKGAERGAGEPGMAEKTSSGGDKRAEGGAAAALAPAAGSRAPKAKPSRPGWVVPAKTAVFAAGLFPLARWVVLGATNAMGANPVEFLTRSSGLWALVFLCVTLAVTPARRLSGWGGLLRFRRMLGLFCFFYATLHVTTYVWLDQWFDWMAIAKDIGKRPFILAGFATFVLLATLAATSPKAAARKMGRWWGRLHRVVYLAGGLAILHFWWMKGGKHDFKLPILYGSIVAALLGFRLLWALAQKARGARVPARVSAPRSAAKALPDASDAR
jgi:methionine sulfoxide reductase heme-binding subunit